MTTDDAKIIESAAERLAFFFSNANLRRDKFLRNELDGNDGFVGIDILLKFNTLKQHTTDAAIVAKAAKHDSVKGLIKLSEDSKKIEVNMFCAVPASNRPVAGTVPNLLFSQTAVEQLQRLRWSSYWRSLPNVHL